MKQIPMKRVAVAILLTTTNLSPAQTPSARMMPDGSKDMYLGLGIASSPRYRGADEQQTHGVALVQMQWSNGAFVSGTSLGMHLSDVPTVEYGPLMALEPGRDRFGTQKLSGIGRVDGVGSSMIGTQSASTAPIQLSQPAATFDNIPSMPVAGGFFNYYLDENLRLTSNVLYGAGNDHDGLLLNVGAQKAISLAAPHHRLSLSAGVAWANRRYQNAYFSVNSTSTDSSVSYRPSAGLRDTQVSLNWNWELRTSNKISF